MPALTFGVATNFALANFLASLSFENVSVALVYGRVRDGSSNETYHVLLAMRILGANQASGGLATTRPKIAGPRSHPTILLQRFFYEAARDRGRQFYRLAGHGVGYRRAGRNCDSAKGP